MENLTASIPHQLTREEAKRRIREQMSTLREQKGGLIASAQETWAGDKMSFSIRAMGESISGHLTVDDHVIQVEVNLPWMLRMLAGTLKQKIERAGRIALGDSGKPT